MKPNLSSRSALILHVNIKTTIIVTWSDLCEKIQSCMFSEICHVSVWHEAQIPVCVCVCVITAGVCVSVSSSEDTGAALASTAVDICNESTADLLLLLYKRPVTVENDQKHDYCVRINILIRVSHESLFISWFTGGWPHKLTHQTLVLGL